MKEKPLSALIGSIQKSSMEDGPGIRTTVFLKGCPLKCRWCHNPELISFEQEIIEKPNSCILCGYCIKKCPVKGAIYIGADEKVHIDRKKCKGCFECVKSCYANGIQCVAKEMTPEDVIYEVAKDKGFYDKTGGGMTVSGGEILSQIDFIDNLILLAAESGINTCIDTSGFGDGERLYALALKDNVTDILYDMKCIDSILHREFTGQSNELILKNLEKLAGDEITNKKIQMRMPLINNVNDSWKIIQKTADFYIKNSLSQVTLLPYHDLGISKMRNIGQTPELFVPPSKEYVMKIKEYFENEANMKVDVLGIVD